MATQLQTHPAPERLWAFANGRLSATEMAELEAHIAVCDSCCEQLGKVPDDTLLVLAREAATQGIKTPGQPKAPPAPKPDPRAIPKELRDHDRYRVLGLIGTGGMGAVYKAEHRRMERLVALKVINPSLLANAQAVERFHREVRVVGKLSHQNIVAVYDADQEGDLHFLVMEFVDGMSLDRVLANNRGPLAPAQAAGFIRQAALGLQHAHEKGMVHRDIKPQNLMLTRKLQVKILDFGLVRSASERAHEVPSGQSDASDGSVTTAGMILGTPDYVAPEQVTDARTADIRADIYSLGCTLYYLLTGQPPFATGSVMEKLNAHMHSMPQSIFERRGDVPAELARVLDKMMAKDPAARYQTPAEVAKALAPLAKGQGGAAVVTPPASTANMASGRREPPGTPTPPATPAPQNAPAINTLSAPADTLVPLPHNEPAILGGDFFGHLDLDNSMPTLPPVVKPPTGSGLPFGATPQVAVLLGLGIAVAIVLLAWGGANWAFTDNSTRETAAQTKADGVTAVTNLSPETPPKTFNQSAPARPSQKVLMVLPSQGLWLPDYSAVKKELNARNVEVVTVSTSLSPSQLLPMSPPGEVKPDRVLDDSLHADEYEAIIFVGANTWEYHPSSPSSPQIRQLMQEFKSQGKFLAAICAGQRVLALHGALTNKTAAKCKYVDESFGDSKARWNPNVPAHRDGQIITARGDQDAPQFADVIVAAIRN